MYLKLAFRNTKRSARDYLVYLLTMTLVSALMYTFNSLLFQNELRQYWNAEDMMEIMVCLATVFIMLVTAWLIAYMVRFMMEKRSAEFGIYLLLGMKKSAMTKLYLRENILLGAVSLLSGMLFGIFLQQVLMAALFSMLGMTYHLHVAFHPGTISMTVFSFGGCYLLSLFRCRRNFKKMNIRDLMEAGQKNEEIKEKYEQAKRLLLPLSVLFILLFWRFFGALQSNGDTALFLVGLVATIFLFYMGLSASIVCYIRKKGSLIYRGENLFLLRQFASKVRTMQFTMGTLTALFTLAFMGSSFALMLGSWQTHLLKIKYPFDILLYSPDPADTFEREMQFLKEKVTPLEYYPYRIYTDGDNRVNAWMLTHLSNWGTMYQNPDGDPNMPDIENMLENYNTYYVCDTYMGLSDYNYLRGMLGYEKITLKEDEYALQIKSRLAQDVQDIADSLKLSGIPESPGSPDAGNLHADSPLLVCGGIYADPFSQDGHNGCDYLIIVPDKVLGRMHPYYSELAVDIDGSAPPFLREELDSLRTAGTEAFRSAAPAPEDSMRQGSDTLIVFGAVNAVRDNLMASMAYMLVSVTIPLFYISLVFLCVAVTVLSVQQLSDSANYGFRYDVLSKLGLKESEIHSLIFRQLTAYYLCPALLAILISGKMILFAGEHFVMMTGVPVSSGSFFLKSIALFFGIYLVYFALTYVSFTRNVRRGRR